MFGNILLVLSLICYGLLANLLSKPRPSGDYGVGYSYAYLYYGVGFVFFTGLLAWNMNANHCFDWVLRYRSGLVFLGWIAFVTMTLWSLEYHMAFIILHLLVFGSCLYLINVEQSAEVLTLWVKIPFYASLLIGLVILGAFGKTRAMKAIEKIQLNSRS